MLFCNYVFLLFKKVTFRSQKEFKRKRTITFELQTITNSTNKNFSLKLRNNPHSNRILNDKLRPFSQRCHQSIKNTETLRKRTFKLSIENQSNQNRS